MNLLFRLFWLMLKTINFKITNFREPLSINFWITPFDCDLNGHMTNSRYYALMDLGRFILMRATPVWAKMWKNFWFPLVQSIELSFIKEIKPFTIIVLKTSVIDYDQKYIYMQQEFFQSNQLVAVGRVKGLFSSSHGLIPTSELFEVLDEKYESEHKLLSSLSLWNEYLLVKKNETS